MKKTCKLLAMALAAALALSMLAGCSSSNDGPYSSTPDSSSSSEVSSSEPSSSEPSSSSEESSVPESSSSEPAGETEGSTVTSGSLSFVLPEGFSGNEESPNMWYAPTYPTDSSNVNISSGDKDPTFAAKLMTAGMFKEATENLLQQELQVETTVNVDQFEYVEVDGILTLRIALSYELSGIPLKQLQVMVDADKTYAITYTQAGDADWWDAFEASVKTISIAG